MVYNDDHKYAKQINVAEGRATHLQISLQLYLQKTVAIPTDTYESISCRVCVLPVEIA